MYIACDIGGTKFRVAKSDDLINFDEPKILETPKNPNDGLALISKTIKEIACEEKIDAMVFGIAGVLNDDHDFLLKSPHLPSWENISIRQYFEKEFDARVFIENDTDIVGLGEAVAGAGRGFEIVIYITVSTGIGGAKIVNGKFEKNRYGFEPGFQILNNETRKNWEDLCSGSAVEERFAMHPKDVAKTENWNEVEKNVAVGLHNSILHWSPDVVVIGGSMARDFNVENLKKYIKEMMKIHPEIPEIKIAELGSIGGIYGGFAYLKSIL